MIKLKCLILLYLSANVVYIFTFVFDFNPLLQIKNEQGVKACHCRYDNQRNKGRKELKSPPKHRFLEESVCSNDATRRGTGQRVISFSMFGEKQKNIYYMKGLLRNVEAIKKYYPSQYIVRIYFDEQQLSSKCKEWLCNIYCSESNVDLCEVNHISKYLGC